MYQLSGRQSRKIFARAGFSLVQRSEAVGHDKEPLLEGGPRTAGAKGRGEIPPRHVVYYTHVGY